MNWTYELVCDDCLKLFSTVEDNFIDCIVTDPAYPVISGGNTTKTHATGGILVKNDGKIFKHNDIAIEDYFPEMYRVLAKQAHCYVFTNNLNLEKMLTVAAKVGFQFHNLLVWKKNNVTPNRWYMKSFEPILMFRKGPAFSINNPGTSNFLEYKNPTNKRHETEKPVALLEQLVINSTQPGQIILDPMMGSGSTGEAAIINGRKFIGWDIDEEHYNTACNRMDALAF